MFYKNIDENNENNLMLDIRRKVLDSNIWNIYKNENIFQSFEYNYDSSSRREIKDGGQDMYDNGNIVSKIIFVIHSNIFYIHDLFIIRYRYHLKLTNKA